MVEPQARSKEYEQRVLGLLECLYDVAFSLTQNAADAQKVAQETVVKALRNHQAYQDNHLKASLLSLLRNTYQDEFARSEEPEFAMFAEAKDLFGRPPVRPRHTGFSALLDLVEEDARQAVESLPDEFRRAVIMADLESKTYKEIAAAMDCPLGTVRSRLFRGRRLLQERLE